MILIPVASIPTMTDRVCADQATARRQTTRMKITRIETIHLKEHATLLFVRVHTDEGLIGHGETKYAIDALHGFIHQYAAPLLLGQDPLQIDRHWRTIYE